MMAEELQLRIHGDVSLPTLIYLPGLHGDWTLIGSFRKNIVGRARFVEITYPRTLTWSLDDYAATIEAALAHNGITRGWLLGESYGSQVLWALVGRAPVPAKQSAKTDSREPRATCLIAITKAARQEPRPTKQRKRISKSKA